MPETNEETTKLKINYDTMSLEQIQSLEALKATDMTKVKSEADYKAKVLEYVEWQMTALGAVKLSSLNRRFQTVGRKLGRPPKSVVEELVSEGKLLMPIHPQRLAFVIIPKEFHEAFLSQHEDMGTSSHERARIWNDIITNAV